MSWKDNQAPAPVTNLTAQVNGSDIVLNWTAPAATANELDKARQFVIYRSASQNIDFNNAANIRTITANETQRSPTAKTIQDHHTQIHNTAQPTLQTNSTTKNTKNTPRHETTATNTFTTTTPTTATT